MSRRAVHRLTRVGMQNPRQRMKDYPHQLSGGMCKRAMIALAMMLDLAILIADEPTIALDVSVQAQILNLLQDLKETLKPTFLFIVHDLSVIEHVSDRVGMMYVGHLVELAPTEEIYLNPRHPYTEALLSSVPVPDPEKARAKEQIVLQGDIPSPIDPPSGCRFRTRCPRACEQCAQAEPELKPVGNDHFVACHLVKAE